MAAIPRKNIITPDTLFSNQILFNLNLCRNIFTKVVKINHQLEVPTNTPATTNPTKKKFIGPLARFTPANIATKKNIAMGFETVRKKTDKKSCESLFWLILCNRSCRIGLVKNMCEPRYITISPPII